MVAAKAPVAAAVAPEEIAVVAEDFCPKNCSGHGECMTHSNGTKYCDCDDFYISMDCR